MNAHLLELLAGAIGFALGKTWDQVVAKRKEIELQLWKIRVLEMEKRLKEFYWPVYLRLERDRVVWKKMLKRENPNEEQQRVAKKLEEFVLLPNHLETVAIIQQNMHFIAGDKALEEALLTYLRHIDIYKAIRASGIQDKDPVYFGEPYPAHFFELIAARLKHRQEEYDRVLAEKASA